MPIKIAMTGSLGSGKSTVCKCLTERFNLKYFSTGVIQRALAVKMGMDTYELNRYSETHPEIDELIDGELVKLSDSHQDMIIDSRMAWHFVKGTYKVFLMTDETVAAERVMAASRGPSERYADTEQAKQMLKARRASENSRYRQTYGVDCDDFSNFDLIIDTTNDASRVSPEAIADLIMENYNAKGKENQVQSKEDLRRESIADGPALLISPLCLYPTKIDGDGASAVKVVTSGEHLFIYEGHNRVSEQCTAGKLLVPCSLAAQNGGRVKDGLTADEYAAREFTLEKAHEWEKMNDLMFRTYPGV
jgi:cytidylate kinase